jgi:hypothetical protein
LPASWRKDEKEEEAAAARIVAAFDEEESETTTYSDCDCEKVVCSNETGSDGALSS